MEKIYSLLKKLLGMEIIRYIIFGAMTTLLSLESFKLFFVTFSSLGQNTNIFISNTLSTILAVLFAFFTNKLWVFYSKSSSFKETMGELLKFSLGRLFTYGVDMALILALVNYMHIEPFFSKIITQIIIIILNYIISKKAVFK